LPIGSLLHERLSLVAAAAYAAAMAALAYALLPLSGTIAFVLSRSQRVRFHGAQAIVVGVAWGLLLYGSTALAPGVTRVVWAVGAAVWLILIAGTAVGRDPALPGLKKVLSAAAATDER
jgi:uncharacterized membrane protein